MDTTFTFIQRGAESVIPLLLHKNHLQAEEVLLEWASRHLATAGFSRLPSSYSHTPAAGVTPDLLPLVRLLSLLQPLQFALPVLPSRADTVTGLGNARYLLR